MFCLYFCSTLLLWVAVLNTNMVKIKYARPKILAGHLVGSRVPKMACGPQFGNHCVTRMTQLKEVHDYKILPEYCVTVCCFKGGCRNTSSQMKEIKQLGRRIRYLQVHCSASCIYCVLSSELHTYFACNIVAVLMSALPSQACVP